MNKTRSGGLRGSMPSLMKHRHAHVGERRTCLLRHTIGVKVHGAIDDWLPTSRIQIGGTVTHVEVHASSGCTIPAVLARKLGASIDNPVAPAVAPMTPVQATGPSGVQPKKWLTPGVWTMATNTAELPSAVATTSGLCRRVSSVCASCVVTRAVNPIVEVRLSVPGVQRPMAQAAVAPAAVTAPRVTI